MAYLVDYFDDNSINNDLWIIEGGSNVLEQNLRLEISHEAAPEYNSLISQESFDLTGKHISVKVVDAGNQSLATHEVVLGGQINQDTTNKIWLTISGNNLQAYKLIDNSLSFIGSTSYDSEEHLYLSIQESNGRLYFNTSTDAVSWTNKWSDDNPFDVTDMQFYLQSGCWNSEASGSYGYFDDFTYNLSEYINSLNGSKYGNFLYGQNVYGVGSDIFEKKFIYKVYSGGVLNTVWSDEVISLPSFSTAINSSPGQCSVKLARPFEGFGEGDDVAHNNRVDIWLFDRNTPDGQLLYRGFISTYTPNLIGGKELIDIILLPYGTKLQRTMLEALNGDTSVPYLTQDPSDLFRGVLGSMQLQGVELDGGTINDTGTSISYTFNTNTGKEAFDKAIELAPANWFWSIDPDGKVNYKEKPTGVTHDLSIGKEIISASPQKRVENLVNKIYFTGGGDPKLYKKYTRQGSIDTYGLYAVKFVDQRVTVEATADIIAGKILDEKQAPEVRIKMRIADDNGDYGLGYNIESIKVGDTIRIKNLQFGSQTNSLWDVMVWDVDVWDYTLASLAGAPLLVVKTKYSPNMIEVETSSRFPEVSKRIEDINRNLENSQTRDNPATPTT
jgi:hypothetical protein